MARWAVIQCFVSAGVSLLLGCPQLLSDRFGTEEATLGGGGGADCSEGGCGDAGLFGSSGVGGAEPVGPAGVGGRSSGGVGGRASGAGGVGGTGVGGGAGGGGGVAGGAGGSSAGSGGASNTPACWTFTLEDTLLTEEEACVGIVGYNEIETDPDSPSTTIDQSYSNGQVCFEGTVGSDGWGAVYNFSFIETDAQGLSWNAEEPGVGGFELELSGTQRPSKLDIKYTDSDGDFCRVLSPVVSVQVPFDSTHPGCVAQPTSTLVPNAGELEALRLVFPVLQSAYDVDFCVRIRALP